MIIWNIRCNKWQGESKNQTYGISPRIYKKYGKEERHKIYINLQLTKTNPCAITCWLCMIKMKWRLGQVCLQPWKTCSPRWFNKSCQADHWPLTIINYSMSIIEFQRHVEVVIHSYNVNLQFSFTFLNLVPKKYKDETQLWCLCLCRPHQREIATMMVCHSLILIVQSIQRPRLSNHDIGYWGQKKKQQWIQESSYANVINLLQPNHKPLNSECKYMSQISWPRPVRRCVFSGWVEWCGRWAFDAEVDLETKLIREEGGENDIIGLQ